MATIALVRSLRELVCGRRIIVPPIQRQYAWNVGDTAKNPTTSQSTKLTEDLENFVELFREGRSKSYFLGNIIAVAESERPMESEETVWDLLDGQQRITSLSLLFKAFDYQLDRIQGGLPLQNEINALWLSLDQNRFPDDDHPYPVKHRRPVDRREFQNFMNGRIDQVGQETNMGRVAHEYRNFAGKFTTLTQISSFIEILLDNVIFSVTITDNLDMGFQMFQTANARGLPLSAYDMFRAFVIKKVVSDFRDYPKKTTRQLERELDALEEVFQSNNWGDKDKARETNLKSFMTAYMSMRAGKLLRANTIISNMEYEIAAIPDPDSLQAYLEDMLDHAHRWKDEVHPGRPNDRSSYRYRFMRRLNRMKVSAHQGVYLSFTENLPRSQADWMLQVIEWVVIKQLMQRGTLGGGTEKLFQKFAVDMHEVWRGDYSTPSKFVEFRDKWFKTLLPGDLNLTPLPYDKDSNCIYALLHRLENDQGLSDCDPGLKSWTTSMIQLAPMDLAGDDNFLIIGNFFLTPGNRNNGLNTTRVNSHNESTDMNARLQTICEMVSNVDHNRNTTLQEMNEHSNFQRFIHERTTLIYNSLNDLYTDFASSEPPTA